MVAGSLEACRLHDLDFELLDAGEVRRRFPAFELPADYTAVWQPEGGFLRAEPANAAASAAGGGGGRAASSSKSARLRSSRRTAASGLPLKVGRSRPQRSSSPPGRGLRELVPELKPAFDADPAGDLLVPAEAAGAVRTGSAARLHDRGRGRPHLRLSGFCRHRLQMRLAPWQRPHRPCRCGQAGCRPRGRSAHAPVSRALHAGGRGGAQGDEDLPLHDDARRGFHHRHSAATIRRIVVASACSGHGYKFASVIGEILADLATGGQTPHDIGRFAIGRFAEPV